MFCSQRLNKGFYESTNFLGTSPSRAQSRAAEAGRRPARIPVEVVAGAVVVAVAEDEVAEAVEAAAEVVEAEVAVGAITLRVVVTDVSAHSKTRIRLVAQITTANEATTRRWL